MSRHRGRPRLRLWRKPTLFRVGAHRVGVPVTPWPVGWYGTVVPVARGRCLDRACPDHQPGLDHLHLDTV